MEIRTVTALRRKRAEIERAIANYERRLVRAREDLAHINATIAIFEASGAAKKLGAYVDVHQLFRRNEMIAICKSALASGPKTTREMVAYIMAAKELDATDEVLAKAIASRLINALGQQRRRGAIVGAQPGARKARIWGLRQQA